MTDYIKYSHGSIALQHRQFFHAPNISILCDWAVVHSQAICHALFEMAIMMLHLISWRFMQPPQKAEDTCPKANID
jgi:hypothetical protein